jgi:hypothetical protein
MMIEMHVSTLTLIIIVTVAVTLFAVMSGFYSNGNDDDI